MFSRALDGADNQGQDDRGHRDDEESDRPFLHEGISAGLPVGELLLAGRIEPPLLFRVEFLAVQGASSFLARPLLLDLLLPGKPVIGASGRRDRVAPAQRSCFHLGKLESQAHRGQPLVSFELRLLDGAEKDGVGREDFSQRLYRRGVENILAVHGEAVLGEHLVDVLAGEDGELRADELDGEVFGDGPVVLVEADDGDALETGEVGLVDRLGGGLRRLDLRGVERTRRVEIPLRDRHGRHGQQKTCHRKCYHTLPVHFSSPFSFSMTLASTPSTKCFSTCTGTPSRFSR